MRSIETEKAEVSPQRGAMPAVVVASNFNPQ